MWSLYILSRACTSSGVSSSARPPDSLVFAARANAIKMLWKSEKVVETLHLTICDAATFVLEAISDFLVQFKGVVDATLNVLQCILQILFQMRLGRARKTMTSFLLLALNYYEPYTAVVGPQMGYPRKTPIQGCPYEDLVEHMIVR